MEKNNYPRVARGKKKCWDVAVGEKNDAGGTVGKLPGLPGGKIGEKIMPRGTSRDYQGVKSEKKNDAGNHPGLPRGKISEKNDAAGDRREPPGISGG